MSIWAILTLTIFNSYISVRVLCVMTQFICVTCQSVKDDIHQKWTDAGVSSCDVCCEMSSTSSIVNTAIDSVIRDLNVPEIHVLGKSNS